MFIRKKKLLKLIDSYIESAKAMRDDYQKSFEERGEMFDYTFTDGYSGGVIDGLDRLKREFTPFKH